MPAQVVFLLAIFPNYALNFIFQVIYQFENGKKTLGLSNIFDTYYYDVNGVDEGFSSNSVSVGGLLLSMIGWSIAFTILSWYIEKIFPGEYGVKLPLYFPFMVIISLTFFEPLAKLPRIIYYYQDGFKKAHKSCSEFNYTHFCVLCVLFICNI